MPSAAVRMYCDSMPAPRQLRRAAHGDQPPDAGFELAWSPEGDPFNQRWSHASCVETLSPLRAILNQPALPRESACPPVATLFATALLSPEEDPTLGPTNEELFDLADGAFLMVGGNFRGSGDLITTPLHTLLPGVYYHAVALQNLLAFDGRPKVRKEFRTPKLAFYRYDLLVLWAAGGDLPVAPALGCTRAPGGAQPLPAVRPPRAAGSPRSSPAGRRPSGSWRRRCCCCSWRRYRCCSCIAVAAIVVALVAIELRVAGKGEIRDRARGLLAVLCRHGAVARGHRAGGLGGLPLAAVASGRLARLLFLRGVRLLRRAHGHPGIRPARR